MWPRKDSSSTAKSMPSNRNQWYSLEEFSPWKHTLQIEKRSKASQKWHHPRQNELQSFLSAVNYLQTFVPHLSHNTEPLWALLKKENSFTWDENSQHMFPENQVPPGESPNWSPSDTDRSNLVTLQCDASIKGLGACIIQDGQPIAFVSKSLTDTETCYANIERELLAIMYGCEKFHTYLTVGHLLLRQTTSPWRWSALRIS